MPSEESGSQVSQPRSCKYPDCDNQASRSYEDRFGNELELCIDHYAEAVLPPPRISKVVNDGDDEPKGLMGVLK